MRVIENNQELQRYQLYELGDMAGFVQYSMCGDELWLHYTQFKRRYKSKDIIEELLTNILEDVRRRRLAVMPFCPAMRSLIAQHHEYQQLVPLLWQRRFLASPISRGQAMDHVRYTGSPKRRSSAIKHDTLQVPISISRGHSVGTATVNAGASFYRNGAPAMLQVS